MNPNEDVYKRQHNPLSEVAGKTKFVPRDHEMVRIAKNMGISFGE